jgi:hypothetical protein
MSKLTEYKGYKIRYDNLLGYINYGVYQGYSFIAGFYYYDDAILFIDAKVGKDA